MNQRSGAERIFVVEDDAALRQLLLDELGDRGYETRGFGTAGSVRAKLTADACDLVICDIRLPDGDGFDVLEAARQIEPAPSVILITAFGSIPQAVEALRAGAEDFLTKPLDLDHLGIRIERALRHRRTNHQLESLQKTLRASSAEGGFRGMIGTSPAMQQVYAAVRRFARVDEPVLITGESGVGKELVAAAIHAESERSNRPLVSVNCASIPENLLEAEFFGHTAGAYTGATGAREGLVREADGGTLFLDEVGEMPATMQAKLLRVLQDGRVRPIGQDTELDVDVRIVAATNRNLVEAVDEGSWRKDLYYRLEALSLEVPPLRDRLEDIPELVAHFTARIAAERELPGLTLTEPALDALHAYGFPGNVRELRNALARAAVFCDGGQIDVTHLPTRIRAGADRHRPGGDDPLGIGAEPKPSLEQVELRYIRWILETTDNNKRRAAEILGIGRRTLYRKLEDTTASNDSANG